MNTPNTHTQLAENLIVVDREWLESMINKFTSTKYNSFLPIVLKEVISNSFPLTPILEEYFKKGSKTMFDISYISGGIVPQVRYNQMSLEQDKQSFLSQPITLKKKLK